MLIVGGRLGGVAAALAATRRGASAILTEETDWLGGQLTTQASPRRAPLDREKSCTAGYQALREASAPTTARTSR